MSELLTPELENSLVELIDFMISPNPTLREVAVSNMFACTGNREFSPFFRKHFKASENFVTVIRSEILPGIKKDAFSGLINLSSDLHVVESLVDNTKIKFVEELVTQILNPNSAYSDMACVILSNLTRSTEKACDVLLKMTNDDLNPVPDAEETPKKEVDESRKGEVIFSLLNAFVNESYNTKEQSLEFLGAVFSNITQLESGRKVVMDKEKFAFQRLLSYTRHPQGVRRAGVVGMIRNCSFDVDLHLWLLGEEIDILPFILYPLAGPEELEEEDMEGMPDELQYLPDDKERETDPGIQKMLLDTLIQLCALPESRKILREKKTYPILREYHTARRHTPLEKPIHDVVQILINDDAGQNLRSADFKIPEGFVENPEYDELEKETAAYTQQSVFGDSLAMTTTVDTSTKVTYTTPKVEEKVEVVSDEEES